MLQDIGFECVELSMHIAGCFNCAQDVCARVVIARVSCNIAFFISLRCLTISSGDIIH